MSFGHGKYDFTSNVYTRPYLRPWFITACLFLCTTQPSRQSLVKKIQRKDISDFFLHNNGKRAGCTNNQLIYPLRHDVDDKGRGGNAFILLVSLPISECDLFASAGLRFWAGSSSINTLYFVLEAEARSLGQDTKFASNGEGFLIKQRMIICWEGLLVTAWGRLS